MLTTARQKLGLPIARGAAAEESALILLGLVLLANIGNLVLLYQQQAPAHQRQRYNQLTIGYALVLALSTVLAWGQPRVVLAGQPIWTILYLLLNGLQAALGIYFAQFYWPDRHAGQALLPLWCAPLYLLVLALLLPLLWLANLIMTLAIGAGVIGGVVLLQWRCLSRICALVPARKSAVYEMLIGGELGAGFLGLLFTVDTLIRCLAGKRLDLISYCGAICLLIVGLAMAVLAAMQRYRLKYEYGAAHRHQLRYVAAGAGLLVVFLVLNCLL